MAEEWVDGGFEKHGHNQVGSSSVTIARVRSGRFTLRETFRGVHLMWIAPTPDIDEITSGGVVKDAMRSLRSIVKGLRTRRSSYPVMMGYCAPDEHFLATLAPGSYRIVSEGREVEWLDRPTTGPRLRLEPEVLSAVSRSKAGLSKTKRERLND